MRVLTLIRHAKSSWNQAKLSDFERPLNERGLRDAPRMAARVLELLGRPDRIVTSPAVRALTTAQCFAGVLELGAHNLQTSARIYDASVSTLFKQVRDLDDADRHVMMFGHNPGFSQLAQQLAPCPFDDMPTCAVVQIVLAANSWGDVDHGCGRVLHYLYPKQFRG